MRRSRCTSTTCAATTPTTSARPCSRRSPAPCAWRPSPIRAPPAACRRPRERSKARLPMRIAVVDYGMGNLLSVSKALEHVAQGHQIVVTADPAAIGAADRVVVPGQGAMPDCMRQLAASGAREAVIAATRSKPFLGLCIGLQMLFERGEEGDTPGLGLLPGRVPRFSVSGLEIPHMGWNEVSQDRPHPLWQGIPDRTRFYFVHSYYAAPRDAALTAATSVSGVPFTCAIARDTNSAVQCYPEKTQSAGLQLLTNFVRWRPRFDRLVTARALPCSSFPRLI